MEPFYGEGLKDKNGTCLEWGKKVKFLGSIEVLSFKSFYDPNKGSNGAEVKRVVIGESKFWLTPSTAKDCEVLL